MSNKKEYKVGDTVQMGLLTFVCEEAIEPCVGCQIPYCNESSYVNTGSCDARYRTDNKDVIFKLKEE